MQQLKGISLIPSMPNAKIYLTTVCGMNYNYQFLHKRNQRLGITLSEFPHMTQITGINEFKR